MDKKDCIIVDLEGTLTNCNHRIHHYNNKEYDQWNELFYRDSVNEKMVDIIKKEKAHGKIIVLSTAKSEDDTEEVIQWLSVKGILLFIDCSYFRESEDHRPSLEVKRDNLVKIMKRCNPVLAYDDRQDLCSMYELNGVLSHLIDQSDPVEKTTPDIFLRQCADLFEVKNKEYGDGYKDFGKIMSGLFPQGLELKTEEDFARFAILNIMIAKVDRYCKNFTTGGHEDSTMDIPVYSAMLQEIDNVHNHS